jgi:hypothetical protein
MKRLIFALWFIFLGHGVQLAFAQESASLVASPSAAVDPYTGGAAPEADSFAGAHYPPYSGVCLTPGTIADFSDPNCAFGPAKPPPQTDLDIRSSAAECAQLIGKNSVVDDSVPLTFKFNRPQQGLQGPDGCGVFDAQLRAAGYAPVQDQSDPNLIRIVPLAQATQATN